MTDESLLADHAEHIVMLQQLAASLHNAMEAHAYDDAMRMVDRARAHLDKLQAAAWAGKRRTL